MINQVWEPLVKTREFPNRIETWVKGGMGTSKVVSRSCEGVREMGRGRQEWAEKERQKASLGPGLSLGTAQTRSRLSAYGDESTHIDSQSMAPFGGGRACTLVSDRLAVNPALPLASCGTSGKLHNLSMSQFPYF